MKNGENLTLYPSIELDFPAKHQNDLVIRTNLDELFSINLLEMDGVELNSIKPEARFLFRRLSHLSFEVSPTMRIDEYARHVKLFQDFQTGPDCTVSFEFYLTEPEERKDSHNLAGMLEPLRHCSPTKLEMLINQDQAFCFDELNAEAFRNFPDWHLNLKFFGLNGLPLRSNSTLGLVGSQTFVRIERLTWLCLSGLGVSEIKADAFKGLEMKMCVPLHMVPKNC
jgi:hypothetical protein